MVSLVGSHNFWESTLIAAERFVPLWSGVCGGRESVDIIKSGGYKISALDIERELLDHPALGEAVVVGVEDDTYGQRVAAMVRLVGEARQKHGRDLTGFEADLRAWLSQRLPSYSIPTPNYIFAMTEEADIPKNLMGKVNKKELAGVVARMAKARTKDSRKEDEEEGVGGE